MPDKHITSETIRSTGHELGGKVRDKALEIKGKIDETNVPFPSFGLLGIMFEVAHGRVQEYARNYLQSAADKLDDFRKTLDEIAKNWEAAEDANKVQFE